MQSGEIDILSRNTTFTFLRDTTIGLRMVMVNFYDGQGFLVRKDAKIAHLADLAGGTICMLQGSTHELNLADWMKQHNIEFKIVLLDTTDVLIKTMLSGRCDAASSDSSNLASIRGAGVPNPDDFVILPDRISKEPLGPMVRRADDQWLDIVRWSMMAMVEAEELGITSENVDKMLAESTNPTVQRLLGKSGDFGKLMGVDNAWAFTIIKQVGNYGESYERNVGMGSSLKLERGENALWTKGGLMYAIPFRSTEGRRNSRSEILAPFEVRSFRFQWPADLLTSWASEMEILILSWYILAETGSVLLLTLYGALIYAGSLIAPLFGLGATGWVIATCWRRCGRPMR